MPLSVGPLKAEPSKENHNEEAHLPPPLALVAEIAVILVCKLCAIFGLWYCFFGPDKRTEQTPEAVAAVFFSHENAVRAPSTEGDPR